MPPACRCFERRQREGVLVGANGALGGAGKSSAPRATQAQAPGTAPGAATFSAKPLRAVIERDREGWGRPAANCKASDRAENPTRAWPAPSTYISIPSRCCRDADTKSVALLRPAKPKRSPIALIDIHRATRKGRLPSLVPPRA